MNWQKIDSAPKDGTRVLVFVPMYVGPNLESNLDYHKASSGVFAAYFVDRDWTVGNHLAYDSSFSIEPTHWRELPKGPADMVVAA